MRYSTVARDDQTSRAIEKQLKTLLGKAGHVENPVPDIVFFIGGDGTFLRAVQGLKAHLARAIFIGIHTGTVGFFCEYGTADLPQLIADIEQHKKRAKRHRLVAMKLTTASGVQTYHAVNEVRIENPFQTFVANVAIDQEEFEHFRGSGLIISSTLGSSAYNKSLGGAIVDHAIEGLQLTEMATIQNNTYRALGSPLLLDPSHTITLTGDFSKTIFGYDHLLCDIKEKVLKAEVFLSNENLALVHHVKTNFVQTLKKTFIR